MDVQFCGAFGARKENKHYNRILPDGEPYFVFIHFHDPVIITVKNHTITTNANACILYTPSSPQYYQSLEGGFTNDYVKFLPSRITGSTLYTGIPLDEIFYVDSGEFIREKADHIAWALTDVTIDHQADMIQTLVDLFDEVKAHMIELSPKFQREQLILRRLIELRNEVEKDPSVWSVEKMAKAFYLTRSHFSSLYRKYFSISPRDDLLRMKMEYSQKLLLDTDLDIQTIAERSGYGDSENFIRAFKQFYNITPLQFRKSFAIHHE